MRRITFTIQSYNLDDAHLQQLIQPGNLLIDTQYPFHGLWHRTVRQEHEGVPLAGRV